jgi:hypothetical protein
MQRCCDRNDELIDRGDTVVRVKEQPFPVQRDDLDLNWASSAAKVACMGRVHASRTRRCRLGT